MYLEPHDYWIYYVNIGLRHQYGISVAESQTFLLAKRPRRRRARRNGCFRRLIQAWNKAKISPYTPLKRALRKRENYSTNNAFESRDAHRLRPDIDTDFLSIIVKYE